jgi:hypothetical protein
MRMGLSGNRINIGGEGRIGGRGGGMEEQAVCQVMDMSVGNALTSTMVSSTDSAQPGVCRESVMR